ncbi:MAG: hypothetical protein ACREU3_16905 [Steroidobacteraceae bacterium]
MMGIAHKLSDSAALESDSVSYRKPGRTWAGHGSGELCDLCHRPIESDQVEYEVELSAGAGSPVLNLHLDCYERWAHSEPRGAEQG